MFLIHLIYSPKMVFFVRFTFCNYEFQSRFLCKGHRKCWTFVTLASLWALFFYSFFSETSLFLKLGTQLAKCWTEGFLALATPNPCIDIGHDTFNIHMSIHTATVHTFGNGFFHMVPYSVTLLRSCLLHALFLRMEPVNWDCVCFTWKNLIFFVCFVKREGSKGTLICPTPHPQPTA